jgi:phosphoserine phosphatase
MMQATNSAIAFAAQLDGVYSGHDIDDTSLEKNPDFAPDFHRDGHAFVVLCGAEVRINDTFVPTGDTLVNLREAFGSVNPETGELWGRIWDRQCKDTKELTFEEHLRLQFEDAFKRVSVEQAIEFAQRTLRPKKGFSEFLTSLQESGVTPIFITNGADLIAGPVMQHFFHDVLPAPVIHANKLVGDQLIGLHGSVGVAKDQVVRELGNVLFFFGDSRSGDGPGAKAVHDRGGHVFTLSGKGAGTLYSLADETFERNSWTHLDDYTNAASVVTSVLNQQ